MNYDRLHEAFVPDIRLFNRLDESAQAMSKNEILSKLIRSSASRYKYIDFTEFDKSKGDITKFKYYTTLSDSLNVLFSTYKEVKEIALMMEMFNQLHSNKKIFKESYLNKNAVGVMIYNTLLLSIFEGTSYIITAMAEFVNKEDGMDIVIQQLHGTKSNVLMRNLERINKDFVSLVDLVKETNIPGNRMLTESAVGGLVRGAIAVLSVGFKIIPAIRELLFLYYFARVKISDTAQIQADFLEANALRLEDAGDEKIAKRQRKLAASFSKVASAFAVKHDNAENTANKEVNDENLDTDVDL